MLFTISKSKKGDGCVAKRCKTETAEPFPGEAWGVEGDIRLCDPHAEAALDFLEAHPDWKPEHRHMRVLEQTGVTVVESDLLGGPAPAEQSKAGPIASLVKLPAPEGETALVQRLKREEEEAKALLADVEALVVETQEDLETVAALLRETKMLSKKLKADKERICGPADEELKRRKSWFTGGERFLNRVEAVLKSLIEDADRKAEENNRKALSNAAEASRKGDNATVYREIARVQHASNLEGISKTYYWEHTVIDENLLPAAFVISVPNHKLLKEHGAHAGAEPPTEIPGVVYTRKLRLAARAATAALGAGEEA